MKKRTLFMALWLFATISVATAQYKLTLNFQNMTPHVGQRLELRIVDQMRETEVARTVLDSIPAANFAVEIFALVEGNSYNVDFFVDFNQNGVYDAPPADHAWRLTLSNVTSDTIVDFVHNLEFTDISWPGPIDVGIYEAIWKGRWNNLTFGSTDSIRAIVQIVNDSISVKVTTRGAFGNPAEITFEFTNPFPAFFNWSSDTIRIQPMTPWSGEIYFVNGQVSGNISVYNPSFNTTMGLEFLGSIGPGQILARYTVTDNGNPFANGYVWIYADSVLKHIPTSVAEKETPALPSQHLLLQNYPNPFNPATTIRYDLPFRADVQLYITDLTGRRVRTLVAQYQAAGTYTVVWDGTNENGKALPSGIYFARLRAGSQVKTVKMMLLK
jgi:hypothetical protein